MKTDLDETGHHEPPNQDLCCLIALFSFLALNPLYAGVVCWTNLFIILGVMGLFCHLYFIFDGKVLANNVDPMIRCHIMSNLGLH